MGASSAAKAVSGKNGNSKGSESKSSWAIVALIVLASAVLAGFYGINEYAKVIPRPM